MGRERTLGGEKAIFACVLKDEEDDSCGVGGGFVILIAIELMRFNGVRWRALRNGSRN